MRKDILSSHLWFVFCFSPEQSRWITPECDNYALKWNYAMNYARGGLKDNATLINWSALPGAATISVKFSFLLA